MNVILLALVACVSPPDDPRAGIAEPAAPGVPPVAEPDPGTAPDPTVTEPAARPSVPVMGGTLLHPDGSALVFASDPEGDRLVALDVASNAVAWAVTVPAGATPFRLAANETTLFATLRDAASIALVDLGTREARVIPAGCPEPRGLAWDDARGELWLACASGELARFDADGSALGSFRIDADLRDVVALPDAIYVSRMRTAEVIGVDRESGAILSRRAPAGMALDRPDGTTVDYAARVGWRLEADPEGTGVVLAHQEHSLTTIPSTGPTGSAAYYGPPPEDPDQPCGSVVLTALSWFPSGGPVSTVALHTDPLPVDVAWSDTDDAWWVATAGSAGSGLAVVPPAEITTGCFTPGTGASARPVAIAFGPAGEQVVQTASPFGLAVDGRPADLGTATPTAPDADAVTASALFHDATPSGVACAGCHPEGQDDGHVWAFPEGPRRTQNLAGGLASTAPYHWNGEFADMTALLDTTLVFRMGGARVDAVGAAALLGWLDGVRPIARTDGATADQVARGAAIFYDPAYGCASCHAAAQLTTPEPAYVGTRGTFAVPSLVGVGSRGPWMHDGCAETLEDRFLDPFCGGTRHGGVVDPADVPDIVAFLNTL